MSQRKSFGFASAMDWYATMPTPSGAVSDGRHLNIRRYTDTPSEMCQPALTDNLLCMHFGGAKEVRRWHAGRLDVHDVAMGSLTLMPANLSNRWMTKGPIDFVHLLISPELIGQVAVEEFDRDLSACHLSDSVGFRDQYLENLFLGLTAAIDGAAIGRRLYVESLLVVLVVTLIDRRSTIMKTAAADAGSPKPTKGGLAPWKLRRVIDYMIEHLASDIGLSELILLTDLSRAQFFRSFKQSTGMTPHRYLAELRLGEARTLLDQNALDIADIATRVGLPTQSRFDILFRHRFGIAPLAYRKSQR